MFDTMKVARKIREARISQNMTQMNLADAMEVSYQAVSNWERGNSMPDISKLEQLCQILHISMEELLGAENTSKTLSRIINKDESAEDWDQPITMEEIQEFAPILPPADVERLVDERLEQKEEEKINLSAIIGLAPFLDEEYLDELVKRAHVESLRELAGLAPFLSGSTLDSLVKSSDPETDMAGINSLAPFLEEETLDWLVRRRLPVDGLRGLTGLAPFLSSETLDKLVMESDLEQDVSGVISLAPFLSEKALNHLVERMSPGSSLREIAGLAPFLSKKTLETLVMSADLEKDMSGLVSLAPFLDEDILDKVLDRTLDYGQTNISGLYPFLSRKTLHKIAEGLMKGQNLNELKSVIHFL